MEGTVMYHDTKRGVQNPRGSGGIVYCGVTFRVPRADANTIRRLEWETPPAELTEPIDLPDGRQLMPMTRGIIERFESIDRDTGDLLVMYRIPCLPRRD